MAKDRVIVIEFDKELNDLYIAGNETAFTVKAYERVHLLSEPVLTEYEVESVCIYDPGSTGDKTKITLMMQNLDRFKNVEGDITVEYANGSLQGVGGPIDPFSITFTPVDLLPVPNPFIPEYVNGIIAIPNCILKRIYYTDGFEKEYITAQISNIDLTLIHVDDLTP